MSGGEPRIKIFHAYNGLLYAPLFLANDLNLFPANLDEPLSYVANDAEAVKQVCHTSASSELRFAICDPLAVNWRHFMGQGDEPCLVGMLIHRVPIWLFNTNRAVPRLSQEGDIATYSETLSKIIAYPKQTTGFLFAKRLQRYFLTGANLETVAFGKEFACSPGNDAVVVTADVLRIVKARIDDHAQDATSTSNPVIFSYALAEDVESKIVPFCFTAVVTQKRHAVKENLHSVLAILGALKGGVHYLLQGSIADSHIELLARRFATELQELGLSTDHDRIMHVRRCLEVMRDEHIFSEDLVPTTEALENAKAAWSEVEPNLSFDIERNVDRLPASLLVQDWPANENIRHAVRAREPKIQEIRRKFEKWHLITFGTLPVLSVLSGMAWWHLVSGVPAWDYKKGIGATLMFLCVVIMAVICVLQHGYLQRNEPKKFLLALGVWFGSGVGGFASGLGLL